MFILFTALRTELNLGLAKKLVDLAEKALTEGEHQHIGSKCLWARHSDTLNRLNEKLTSYQLKQVHDISRF